MQIRLRWGVAIDTAVYPRLNMALQLEQYKRPSGISDVICLRPVSDVPLFILYFDGNTEVFI